MTIRWEIDDGYAGKSRPHYLELDDEDLEDFTDEERTAYIERSVQQDFEATVSWVYTIC